jgi:hypothetical protein
MSEVIDRFKRAEAARERADAAAQTPDGSLGNLAQKGLEFSGAAGDITIVRPAAAAPPRRPEQVEMRRARFFGDHPQRDKEHQLASRKWRRESTPQTTKVPPCWRDQVVVEVDPVARRPRPFLKKKTGGQNPARRSAPSQQRIKCTAEI